MKFNFEGKTYNEVGCVDILRAQEVAGIMAGACREIEDNFEVYTFTKEEGKNKGHTALHRGKILQRLLRDITEEQEILMVCFSLDMIETKIQNNLDRKRIAETLIGPLKEAIDDFFDNKKPNTEAKAN